VGYIIESVYKKIFYVPDCDKFTDWDIKIEEILQRVDIAYLDGTFFSKEELPGRNLTEIPHPMIKDSIDYFLEQCPTQCNKIKFIHFNHSNPLVAPLNDTHKYLIDRKFDIAKESSTIEF